MNRLIAWVNRCAPLKAALEARGYRKTAKWFNPLEVKLIVEHLCDP